MTDGTNAVKKDKQQEIGKKIKQDTGVEPASSAWEADILPMY